MIGSTSRQGQCEVIPRLARYGAVIVSITSPAARLTMPTSGTFSREEVRAANGLSVRVGREVGQNRRHELAGHGLEPGVRAALLDRASQLRHAPVGRRGAIGEA